MSFRTDLLVPFGYGRQTVTLGWLHDWLLVHHHPEYVARLVAFLDHAGGLLGVGGGWRADGTQPSASGFAPEGRSFHQNQQFADGFIGAAAVDGVRLNPTLGVHLTPRWGDFPEQHTPEALIWGVHANLEQGTAKPEPWHWQPIEIDGWQSWRNAGSPAPAPGYPFPGRNQPEPPPDITIEEDMMLAAVCKTKDGPHLAQFAFRGPVYKMGDTDDHDVTPAEVFGRGGSKAFDIGTGRVVSWSVDSPGSWAAVKPTLTEAQARARMAGQG